MANRIDGKVVEIGEQGNLITDIPIEQIRDIPHDDSVNIRFGDHVTMGLFPPDHDQPDSTMVASLGPSGFLEIEIVGVPLAEMLGIKVDQPVEVSW